MCRLYTSHSNLFDCLLLVCFGWFDNYKLQHKYRLAGLVFVILMKNPSKNQWLLGLLIRRSLDKSFSFSVTIRVIYEFLCRVGSGKGRASSVSLGPGRSRVGERRSCRRRAPSVIMGWVFYLQRLLSCGTSYRSRHCVISCPDNFFLFLLCKLIDFAFFLNKVHFLFTFSFAMV